MVLHDWLAKLFLLYVWYAKENISIHLVIIWGILRLLNTIRCRLSLWFGLIFQNVHCLPKNISVRNYTELYPIHLSREANPRLTNFKKKTFIHWFSNEKSAKSKPPIMWKISS